MGMINELRNLEWPIYKHYNWSTASGTVVASGTENFVKSIRIKADQDAIITVYDNYAATGIPVLDSIVIDVSVAGQYVEIPVDEIFFNGIYISVSCAGTFATQIIYF